MNIRLIPVDKPQEDGFYIMFSNFLHSPSTTIVEISDGAKILKKIAHGSYYKIDGDSPSVNINDYKWIHIKITKPINNIPSESGIYWVWKSGCVCDMEIVNYNAKVKSYTTIGKIETRSVADIQDFIWQKIDKPSDKEVA